MKVAVVDASVAVKWVVPELMSEQAMLLQAVGTLIAPAHWLAEATNALWAKVIQKEMTKSEADERSAILASSPVVTTQLPSLVRPAFDLAMRLNCTMYDSLYLALAISSDAPVVTADRKFFNKVAANAKARDHVIWLGDLRAEFISSGSR